MEALTNKMIVISFDCLAASDFSLIKKLPNFKRLFNRGSYARQVETIYPSLTYPCHATIVTGNYPRRHGIVNNTLMQPGMASPDWNWYRSAIKGTTLYDEAYKANLTTAALLWPITGRAKGIKYNLPEIFANRKWQNQIMVSLLNGTPLYQMELNKRFGHIRKGLSQPELDDFVLESTIHTIRTKKTNLTLVHFTDLDTMRHHHGVFSKAATRALHRHDERLGRILDALEESDQLEESTIVVLGDHSALDEQKAINLNVLFHKHKLIQVNAKGKITDWQVYCKSCDGSAYIYLKNPDDQSLKDKVEQILCNLRSRPDHGIEQMITGDEAGKKGADPTCAFMLEAKLGFYFLEDCQGDYIKYITPANRKLNPKYMLACHGYSPDKPDYTTFFLASGKGIQPKEVIPSMRLVDIGPTLARMLGLDLGETDGRVIDKFLNTEQVYEVI